MVSLPPVVSQDSDVTHRPRELDRLMTGGAAAVALKSKGERVQPCGNQVQMAHSQGCFPSLTCGLLSGSESAARSVKSRCQGVTMMMII